MNFLLFITIVYFMVDFVHFSIENIGRFAYFIVFIIQFWFCYFKLNQFC